MASLNFSSIDRLNLPTSMKIGADDAVLAASVTAVKTALDNVLIGSAVKATKTIATVVEVGSSSPPADVDAERERKWLLRIQDSTTGQIYAHEIGTADRSVLPSSTTDFMDLAAGVGLALKSAIEAVYESPDGNAGVLLSVQAVSRTG